MLLVKTQVKISTIAGLGLFAAQDIPKGTLIWIDDPKLSYITFTDKEWEKLSQELSPESYRQMRKYTYKFNKDNVLYLNLDDTRFFNHSEHPNVGDKEIDDVALKDIQIGEELLIDYRTFYNPDWFAETMKM